MPSWPEFDKLQASFTNHMKTFNGEDDMGKGIFYLLDGGEMLFSPVPHRWAIKAAMQLKKEGKLRDFVWFNYAGEG